MRCECPRVVIAAPSSGSGKSVVASGLMAALARERRVQGFKVGPDYIDPMYHAAATGRPSRNLDTWMVPHDQVTATFVRATQNADVAVVEGVMGLYDGYDATSEAGSTAEVAKLLGAPAILVLDVARMARSAGALALGYRDYDPDLNVAGVICNRVAGARHAEWVTRAIEEIGLPVLGCLHRDEALVIPERHLGLHTAVEKEAEVAAFLQRAADLITEHVDLSRLETLARGCGPLITHAGATVQGAVPTVRLAVARDEAFCFYYEDNLDLLRAAGVETVFFSPLRDERLPEGVAGIYLGGGYPELYAARLAANASMRDAIRHAHAEHMPIYAECGGLMALTESLVDLNGASHTMYGLLPGRSRMVSRLTMGYREVTALADTLLLAAGATARGHEFHYSVWEGRPGDLPGAYRIAPRTNQPPSEEGAAIGNLLASYVHLHLGARPGMAERLISACRRFVDARCR